MITVNVAEGKWTGDPRPMRRRFYRDRLIVGGISALFCLVVFTMLTAGLYQAFRLPGWLALDLVFACVFLSVYRWSSDRMLVKRDAGPVESALLEDPSDPGIALVEAIFADGSRRIGVDRGMIWVADGLLHFRGTATYFALPGAEFELARSAERSDLMVRNSRSKVRFYPLLVGEGAPSRFARVIESAAALVRDRSTSAEPVRLPPADRWRRA